MGYDITSSPKNGHHTLDITTTSTTSTYPNVMIGKAQEPISQLQITYKQMNERMKLNLSNTGTGTINTASSSSLLSSYTDSTYNDTNSRNSTNNKRNVIIL